MPELPEVQVLSAQLHSLINGLTVSFVRLPHDDLLVQPKEIFESRIPGRKILGVFRKGKFIQIQLEREACLWLHLGMTGSVVCEKDAAAADKTVHLILGFHETGNRLYFRDVRKFGKIVFSDAGEPEFVRSLGPDPFSMTENNFVERFRFRTGRIKSLLLNQKIVSGLGNIYADESLFRAMVRPQQRAHRIRKKRLKDLYHKICEVLNEAIDSGGSTIDDFRHASGAKGSFQKFHRVYGREGSECLLCGQTIRKIFLSGRSAHFCPSCQR